MSNPFLHDKEKLKKVPRSTFDLSYQNNGTYAFGKIYPIDVRPVIPGQSVSIKADLGLKLMPMAFPTQTRVKAYVHSFYVRNRNLWDDFTEFIMDTNSAREPLQQKDIHWPVLSKGSLSKNPVVTGSIYDYMGVPTTTANNSQSTITLGLRASTDVHVHSFEAPTSSKVSTAVRKTGLRVPCMWNLSGVENDYIYGWMSTDIDNGLNALTPSTSDGLLNISVKVNAHYSSGKQLRAYLIKYKNVTPDSSIDPNHIYNKVHSPSLIGAYMTSNSPIASNNMITLPIQLLPEYQNGVDFVDGWHYAIVVGYTHRATSAQRSFPLFDTATTMDDYTNALELITIADQYVANYMDASDVGCNPFMPDSNGKIPIRLNALPFRAYESCCNCYMRNDVIDPYYINGIKEFNKYCVTTGGEDGNVYDFHYRNFEYDFLTSCLPSPQMGDAPLVGLTTKADNASQVVFTFHEPDDPDGKLYTATGQVTNGQVSSFSIVSDDMPKDLKSIIETATTGISIRDMRNAMALQKYLEVMIKNGYKYRDYLRSIHGVEPDYATLDMPEFIGGYTTQMVVNPITQQVETEDAQIGSLKANAFIAGSTDRFTKYCDEHGYIVTTLCIMPMANYSQLLPKHMLQPVNDLSFYNPAFTGIGPQPVSYLEVCPIERYRESLVDNTKKVTDTFGYNRAWYELLASYDTIHGDLRKSLSGYVINRQFYGSPELSRDFIRYTKGCVNTPFVDTTEQEDIAIGQIWFDIKVKLPVFQTDIAKLG